MADSTYTQADLSYIREHFVTLEELCRGRPEAPAEVRSLVEQRLVPQPAYVLDDGTGMFGADHLRLVDDAGGVDGLQAHFAARHRAASDARGTDPRALPTDWDGYLRGVYGVCLRVVTPENIVAKNALVTSLCELLVLAEPASAEWRDALRSSVDELDALELPFSPDYDRDGRFGRPPTRDLLVTAARERFPGVFADGALERV